MQFLEKNQTWILEEPPMVHKIIGNCWVCKIKLNSNDNAQQYKATRVAGAVNQVSGVDYNDTSIPFTRFHTIRTLLSTAASQKLFMFQFDVKPAFLYR